MTQARNYTISKHEGNERLKTLYAMLDGIPSARLKMGSWRENGTMATDKVITSHACNTSACAMGWAAANPEFHALGLYWDKHYGVVTHKAFKSPENMDGFDSAKVLFKLTEEQSNTLFSPTFSGEMKGKFTEKQVVLSRIRKFLVRRRAISAARSKELAKLEVFTS